MQNYGDMEIRGRPGLRGTSRWSAEHFEGSETFVCGTVMMATCPAANPRNANYRPW